ncbi:hypothetical protein ACER0A_003255 [Haloimpatiens sp. FM7315]|uniref:hypothetical protein n=1 Tax=Haloimpatiens sp. FM7315 TaxID=3298609 RepID=UPI00370BB75E
MPSLEEAKLILKKAEELNPGPWVQHSLYVGKVAELIAKKDKELNSHTALVLGMVDVVMRYGFNEFTLKKWNVAFEIQRCFEERIGTSIYSILPNIK